MKKDSLFGQFCALNYMYLAANHPAMLRMKNTKRG